MGSEMCIRDRSRLGPHRLGGDRLGFGHGLGRRTGDEQDRCPARRPQPSHGLRRSALAAADARALGTGEALVATRDQVALDLLIVVGVALDTAQQIESHLVTRSYEGFAGPKGPRIRGRKG